MGLTPEGPWDRYSNLDIPLLFYLSLLCNHLTAKFLEEFLTYMEYDVLLSYSRKASI